VAEFASLVVKSAGLAGAAETSIDTGKPTAAAPDRAPALGVTASEASD